MVLHNFEKLSNLVKYFAKKKGKPCSNLPSSNFFLSKVPKKNDFEYLFQFSNITISQDIFDYLEAKSLKEASLDEKKSKRLCILHTVKVMSNNTNMIFYTDSTTLFMFSSLLYH